MSTRNGLAVLIVLVMGVPAALADIGPPRVAQDVINLRLYTAKDHADYVFYACRSDKAPEQITISTDKPIEVDGALGAQVWFAAVPKDSVEKLGGEEKIVKNLAARKGMEGVFYSTPLACSRVAARPPGGVVTNNYEVTIENKKVYLKYMTDAQAEKKFKGSGSKQIIWSNSPDGGGDGQPPFWTWEKLQSVLAALLLATAVALGGIWLVRRRGRLATA